jgi:hypothetical protein
MKKPITRSPPNNHLLCSAAAASTHENRNKNNPPKKKKKRCNRSIAACNYDQEFCIRQKTLLKQTSISDFIKFSLFLCNQAASERGREGSPTREPAREGAR